MDSKREVCGEDNETYAAAKGMAGWLVERAGCISLLGLQGMVLVALYEYGQGIMPSAWMSVGACARLAELCGLPGFKESSSVLGPVVSSFVVAVDVLGGRFEGGLGEKKSERWCLLTFDGGHAPFDLGIENVD